MGAGREVWRECDMGFALSGSRRLPAALASRTTMIIPFDIALALAAGTVLFAFVAALAAD
jgi:hypothetical protein